VPVRGGARHLRRAHRAAAADPVLHHDRLAQGLGQGAREEPRHDVRRPARRERHDDLHRPGREAFRPRGRGAEQRRPAEQDREKPPPHASSSPGRTAP
jgi:hypothetical protein